MFATEFSQILIDTLSDIAHNIPALRDTIQERLLNVLSMYLTTKDSGRSLHRQSIISPNTSASSSSLTSPRDSSVLSHSPVQPGPINMMNLLPAVRTPQIIQWSDVLTIRCSVACRRSYADGHFVAAHFGDLRVRYKRDTWPRPQTCCTLLGRWERVSATQYDIL